MIALNHPVTAAFRGKRRSYKSIAKLIGVKAAAKVWRKARKHHAGKKHRGKPWRKYFKVRRKHRGHRRSRYSSGRKAIRFKGKRRTWKGLVRLMGVKKAVGIWRHTKKVGSRKHKHKHRKYKRSKSARHYSRKHRRHRRKKSRA